MFAVSVQSNAVESSTQADLLLDRLSAQHQEADVLADDLHSAAETLANKL